VIGFDSSLNTFCPSRSCICTAACQLELFRFLFVLSFFFKSAKNSILMINFSKS